MDDGPLALEAEIRRRIRVAGPMPIGQYMAACLSHPEHGYYMTRDPFGEAGDFITSPEISQMFGELIGLWAGTVWRMMDAPAAIALIELGPGRGTLMLDAMRAAKAVPGFEPAISMHLVETSQALRSAQQKKLGGLSRPASWYSSLADVPRGPAIVIANEFFDALPVNQAVRLHDGWHERTIEIGSGDKLAYGVGREPMKMFERTMPRSVRNAPVGSIFEWRSQQAAFELGRRVARGGAALVIDYGHIHSDVGDTFQAIHAHRYDSPLSAPGFADVTAHVDFEALGLAASTMGARCHGPVEQATFLRGLGIRQRAAGLKMKASMEQEGAIDAALARLTNEDDTGMGKLFKAIGLSDPALMALPGFETAPPRQAARA